MPDPIERNLGAQPIRLLMEKHNLKPHDLVATAPGQLTHKMVARACKGRRLTPHSQALILTALNRAAKAEYLMADLFNYSGE